MNIIFNNVVLHNFGSYAHAELNLTGKGFCAISGVNNYAKDNALSNGSGKSFIWSAICFAITGETINGLSKNLKNINNDEQEAYVKLDFNINYDHYELTRIISPKTDLRIIKNSIDASGKGIRESEKILGEMLPDLNKDLIATMIILGQGMPNKFSSFSPVGRKELLEKLTKSDFMIDDAKQRVKARQLVLNNSIRDHQDSLLVLNTQLTAENDRLVNKQTQLTQIKATDYTKLITELTEKLSIETTNLQKYINEESALTTQLTTERAQLSELTTQKYEAEQQLAESFHTATVDDVTKKAEIEARIGSLVKEINHIKAIKDVCPTCGQKLIGVSKPSTVTLENEVKCLTDNLQIINEQYTSKTAKLSAYKIEVNKQFANDINVKQTLINDLSSRHAGTLKNKNATTELVNDIKLNLELEKQKAAGNIKLIDAMTSEIDKLNLSITDLTNRIETIKLAITDQQLHLATVNKIDTLIKRDFRGYLLTDIIKYIDRRTKNYCNIVFGTTDIAVYLDGNALDITYCNKMFDNLSGGEKQRVDLILQFALRDLLSAYLNISSNIIVLDEITDFLDKKSCKAVMDLIEAELGSTESVFLVSHHADALELPIDSTIKIVKNENGISEIVEQ